PANVRRPRAYDILSVLAGPALHFLLAAAAVGVGVLVVRPGRPDEIFGPLVQINATLGLTSLLPIPPLAGGEVFRRLARASDASFAVLSRWSGLLLMVALNFETVRLGMSCILFVACWPFFHLWRALSPAVLAHPLG
ncbi:MAG TPA: hypothetical protein VHV47_03270, partial [Opitutaceae bacterium]|nr:hypothetical protein [Opitutaceae bacterium]